MAEGITDTEFEELKRQYPVAIPPSDLMDLPWGRMQDAQFSLLKERVAGAVNKGRPDEYRRKQRDTGLYPTRQADGTWVRAIDWQSMSGKLQTAEDTFGSVFTDYGPEHWFNYFWLQDARNNEVSEAEKRKFCAAARHFFIFDKQLGKPKLNPDLHGRLRNINNDNLVRELLEATLECAFTRVAMPSAIDRYGAEMRLVREFSRQLTALVNGDSRRRMGWRCETRSYEQVLASGGLTRQVDAEVRRRALHFDQKWHPFSEQKNVNCFWYRRQNRDNDNFLVISVAHAFAAAICFPKIGNMFTGLPADPMDWPPSTKADFKDYIYEVHFTDGGPPKMMVGHDVNVFLFLIDGDFFDTQAYQVRQGHGGFPEWGASRIDRSTIWGAIPVTKIYHGLSDADGFTAIIHRDKALTQIKRIAEWQGAGAAWDATLQREFYAVLANPVFGRRWTGGGGEDVAATIDNRVVDPARTRKVGHVALLKQAFEMAGKNLGGGHARIDIGRPSSISPVIPPRPGPRPRGSTV